MKTFITIIGFGLAAATAWKMGHIQHCISGSKVRRRFADWVAVVAFNTPLAVSVVLRTLLNPGDAMDIWFSGLLEMMVVGGIVCLVFSQTSEKHREQLKKQLEEDSARRTAEALNRQELLNESDIEPTREQLLAEAQRVLETDRTAQMLRLQEMPEKPEFKVEPVDPKYIPVVDYSKLPADRKPVVITPQKKESALPLTSCVLISRIVALLPEKHREEIRKELISLPAEMLELTLSTMKEEAQQSGGSIKYIQQEIAV